MEGIVMRKLLLFSLLILAVVTFTSCSREESTTAPEDSISNTQNYAIDPELVAGEIIQTSGWEYDPDVELPSKLAGLTKRSGSCQVTEFGREVIEGNIAHYWWVIQVGNDPNEKIALHRVVKERRPYRPKRARKSVFMLHGDYKDFVGCFLPGLRSAYKPADFGIAAFLAQEGVDVWGMDQVHNLIPADATDFSFMADWDMYKYVHDTRTGMAIARSIRLFTGNGWRKINLLGFSGGAALGFAVVNEETKLPRGWRHVGGFIPVDQGMFSDDADFAAGDCATAEYFAGLIDSGEYAEENFLPIYGVPAREDPGGPSMDPDFAGFTNLQAAIGVAAYPTYADFPYHFLAGEFDADGLSTGLQYTNVDLWVDFMVQAPPFFANAFSRDEYLSSCGSEFAPWTHQLGDVGIPVYYVSAAGGFGTIYALTLEELTSADVSTLTVELHPTDEVELDFAHIDLFTADNAQELVWQPIKQWIMSTH
jgi:hypothetical protein